MLVAAGVLAITVSLIRYREFKNLWQNILGFLGGALTVFLPFAVYFCNTGRVRGYAVWNIYFFNLTYISDTTSWISEANRDTYISFIYIFFCAYSIFFYLISCSFKKKPGLAGWFLAAGIVEMYLYINSSLYYHYPMVVLPQFVFLVKELMSSEEHRWIRWMKRGAMVVFLLFL